MLVGNKVLTLFTNIITNLNLTDMETRYKVLRQKVIREPKANGECMTFQFLIRGGSRTERKKSPRAADLSRCISLFASVFLTKHAATACSRAGPYGRSP
jgi:hypothetical protein